MASITKVMGKFRMSGCLLLAAILCMATALPAKPKGKDRLAEALDLLEKAKDSAGSTTYLYQARDEVDGTLLPEKKAAKEKALKAIDDAITASTLHTNVKDALNHAIESVRSLAGMGNGKKKK
jgi:hypothetical protein